VAVDHRIELAVVNGAGWPSTLTVPGKTRLFHEPSWVKIARKAEIRRG